VREVITLQFGSFANYVGAHFWNIQVSNIAQNKPCRRTSLLDQSKMC